MTRGTSIAAGLGWLEYKGEGMHENQFGDYTRPYAGNRQGANRL